jgi:hypothetical protein
MRTSWRLGACALSAFVVLAAAQAWPLPSHLSTHLTGAPSGDTGVYVWNMWVFRHEVLDGASPLRTSTIFSLNDGADLSLHNYTTFANLIGLPLQGWLGLVAAFNAVYLINVALAGFGMFLLARRVTGRPVESWIAGALFACSPFLVTRGSAHFSLVAAAPLPIFLWWLMRTWETRRRRDAVGLGVTLAWAAYCDVYYGVYCILLGACYAASRVFVAAPARPRATDGRQWRRLLDAGIVALVCVIVVVNLVGQGSLRLGPLVVSMRTLYTPVLILTVLVLARLVITMRLRVGLRALPTARELVSATSVAVIAAMALLSPVIYAIGVRVAEGRLVRAPVLWRSSSQGADLLGLALPNPNHPLMPAALSEWLATRPGGLHDQVASLSFVAILVIAWAWRAGYRPDRFWMAITAGFGLMTLGPFIQIAGLNTYIPTPWALLRYVPIVGEARMPSRFAIVAMLGLAVLFASALAALAERHRRRRPLLLAAVGLALAFELAPVPRTLYSAEIPAVFQAIAADPRPVRVLNLPFGVRDGLSSLGNFNASSQYYQTLHGKRLIGGYLSRVSDRHKAYTRRQPVLSALMRLSEGKPLTETQATRARRFARRFAEAADVAYVVMDRRRVTPELRTFAIELLRLDLVESSGVFDLYVPRPR